MSKHTETPFRVHDNCGRKGEIGIIADDAPCLIAIMANGGRGAWPIEAKANAEFIVRACNAHDDLLAACKAVAAALDRIQQDGSIVWLHDDDCAVHESASERLAEVIAKAEQQ